jgi:ribosome-binding factor A
MAGRRAARVAERIREEASQIILYELQDPRLGLITVTKVDISADLRYATIYVSVLGSEGTRRAALRGLESARGLVQRRIGRSLRLRETPALRFEYDPSIEKSIQMSRLLDQVAAELPDEGQADSDDTDCADDGATEGPAPTD